MKCKYAVTFEFTINLPITQRGYIEATSVRTCAARALDESIDANPRLKWTSISILLERESIDDSDESTNEEV